MNERKLIWKYDIGENILNNYNDIVILDKIIKIRERYNDKYDKIYKERQKWYKYRCLKCGHDYLIEENNLVGYINKNNICKNCKFIKTRFNYIHPELVKILKNKSDGWKYSYGNGNVKIDVICPDCGFEKKTTPNCLNRYGFTCPICNNNFSYPEKFMRELLINFEYKIKNYKYQLTSKNCKWCDRYRYDFYFKLNGEEYIIETHGIQHYKETTGNFKELKQIIKNDNEKYNLAIQNGIKPENYIVIDCKYSDFDFIKNNIINSRLSEIFDFKNIDWIKIGNNCEKSIVKEICDYWRVHNNDGNEFISTHEIAKKYNLCHQTISRYLHKGEELGWCKYDTIEIKRRNIEKTKLNIKKIKVYLDKKIIYTFNSLRDMERRSLDVLGVKLYRKNVSKILNSETRYKGYTFKNN